MGELGRPTRNFPLILTKDAALDRVAHILSENPDIDAYVKE